MRERRPDRTLGSLHDEFWRWCEAGELRVPQCESCCKLLWPVTERCDRCGGAAFNWPRLSGRGRIISWGTFVQDYYKGILQTPYDTILVELAEGPLFVGNPDGFGEADIRFGMPVAVRFRPCEDSAGSFSLPVFSIASEAG